MPLLYACILDDLKQFVIRNDRTGMSNWLGSNSVDTMMSLLHHNQDPDAVKCHGSSCFFRSSHTCYLAGGLIHNDYQTNIAIPVSVSFQSKFNDNLQIYSKLFSPSV